MTLPQDLSPSDEVRVESVERVICHGRVHDKMGLPIADVRVWAQAFNQKMECNVLAEEAVTDKQGEFILKASTSRDLDPEGLLVYFDHPDYGLWANMIRHTPEESSSEATEVTLYPSEVLVGTVIDSEGRAIEGAVVEAIVQIFHNQQNDVMFRWKSNQMSVKTDRHGIFVLDRLPQPARIRLKIDGSAQRQGRVAADVFGCSSRTYTSAFK